MTDDKNTPDRYECALLGGMILRSEIMDRCMQEMKPSDFVTANGEKAFVLLSQLYNENMSINSLTVADEAERRDVTIPISYIASLTNEPVIAPEVNRYIMRLRDYVNRKKMLSVAGKIREMVSAQNSSDSEIIDAWYAGMAEIEDNQVDNGFVHISSVMTDVISDILKGYKEKQSIQALNRLIISSVAWFRGIWYSVGGRPGTGKSALLNQMAIDATLAQGKNVAVFSMEMSNKEIARRVISNVLRVDGYDLRNNRLSQDSIDEVDDIIKGFEKHKFYVNDQSRLSVENLRRQVRKLKKKGGLNIVFVDYMSLFETDESNTRWIEMSKISRTLKSVAREFNVLMVILSQLTRDSHGKAPTLASMRETGSIEQDADIVLLLHEIPYEGGDFRSQDRLVVCTVAKNRNGSVGQEEVIFSPDYMLFKPVEVGIRPTEGE